MQIKTTVRCHFTAPWMAIIKKMDQRSGREDVENLESLHLAGGHVKWCSRFGAQSGSSSKN